MQITRYATVPSLEHPDFWIHEFDARLWRQVVVDLFGSDELAASAQRRWASAIREDYAKSIQLVASIDAVPAGTAVVEFPQKDNRRNALLSVVVEPGYRCRGIGSALLKECGDLAEADGRTNLQCWTYEPLLPTGPRRLRGTNGDGEIDPDSPSAGFLIRRGFTLMQVDTMSALDLGPDLEGELSAARAHTPGDYQLIQWRGQTPTAWRDGVAELQRAMSTDIPTGGAALEEEEFDAERIRAADDSYAAAGVTPVVTAALHVPSGLLVGFTRAIMDAGGEEVADQWETIVLRGHRGHGLGMLMKTANHVAARSRWPRLRRLTTGNASENEHMLRINRRLGYRPIAASGWFEKKS